MYRLRRASRALRLQRGGVQLQRPQRVGDVLECREHSVAILRFGHFVGGLGRAFLMQERKAVEDGLRAGDAEAPDAVAGVNSDAGVKAMLPYCAVRLNCGSLLAMATPIRAEA